MLCMSPMNPKFPDRARKFPGLVSGPTIDWFLAVARGGAGQRVHGFIADFPHRLLRRGQVVPRDAHGRGPQDGDGRLRGVLPQACAGRSTKRPSRYLSFIAAYKAMYTTKLDGAQGEGAQRHARAGEAHPGRRGRRGHEAGARGRAGQARGGDGEHEQDARGARGQFGRGQGGGRAGRWHQGQVRGRRGADRLREGELLQRPGEGPAVCRRGQRRHQFHQAGPHRRDQGRSFRCFSLRIITCPSFLTESLRRRRFSRRRNSRTRATSSSSYSTACSSCSSYRCPGSSRAKSRWPRRRSAGSTRASSRLSR